MRPTKLLFLLSAALLLLLAGCASQAPATDQEEAAAPAPAVTGTAAPRQGGPGEPLIFLKGDGQGMVTTRWAEGDRAVQVTLPFTYTTQENGEMRIAGTDHHCHRCRTRGRTGCKVDPCKGRLP